MAVTFELACKDLNDMYEYLIAELKYLLCFESLKGREAVRVQRFVGEMEHFHVVGEMSSGEAYIDGRLLFVTGQHPNFNSGLSQRFDRLGDALLQSVFNCSCSEQAQVCFYEVVRSCELRTNHK